jgi:ribosomal protein S18 acetylase RimI-like enzyme
MAIHFVKEDNKNYKKYLNLLLLADPSEKMIEKYIYVSDVFLLKHGPEVLGICCMLKKASGIELKNIAIAPEYQGRGYGILLARYAMDYYLPAGVKKFIAGTAESDKVQKFYTGLGFRYKSVIPNFFVDNYDGPVTEDGKQYKDMLIFEKKALRPKT